MNHQLALIESNFDTIPSPGSVKGAMKAAKAGSRDLWQVNVDALHVIEGFNPRVMNAEYEAHIRSLCDSIKSEGYYQNQPMAGYASKLNGEPIVYIYGGHSRLAAVKLANIELAVEGQRIERVPVVVSQEGLSREDMTVALLRDNGGRSLTYYESAIVCKRLVRFGLELSEISKRLGFSVPTIKNRLALMAAPSKFRELVANGHLAATLAIELLDQHGENALSVLEASQEVAASQGKDKVRKSHTDLATFSRVRIIKKSAPRLYEAAGQVLQDPAFASLSEQTQDLLKNLLSEISIEQSAVTGQKDLVDIAETKP